MRRWIFICALATALGALASPAAANGRYPAAGQLVASSSASLLALETTFGLIVSRDGVDWDWVCESVVGYGGEQDPSVAIRGQQIFVGFRGGLAESRSAGCDWATADLRASSVDVIDIAKPVGDEVIAVASLQIGLTDAGGADLRTMLLRKVGDGSFTPHGAPFDKALAIETVDVAPSDPERVYLSGLRSGPSGAEGVFLSSNDGGLSFAQHTITLAVGETPFIAAIDPNDARRVYVRTAGAASNRLFVTDDGGESFRLVFTAAGPLLGFALSADGSMVFVGGPSDGLHRASAHELVFTRVSDAYVKCLATVGSTLYACSEMHKGYILGASDDQGETFRPALRFDTIRGALACGKTALACTKQWPALMQRLGVASIPDASASTDAPTEPAEHVAASPSACQSSPHSASARAVLLVFACAVFVLFTLRKRMRSETM